MICFDNMLRRMLPFAMIANGDGSWKLTNVYGKELGTIYGEFLNLIAANWTKSAECTISECLDDWHSSDAEGVRWVYLYNKSCMPELSGANVSAYLEKLRLICSALTVGKENEDLLPR